MRSYFDGANKADSRLYGVVTLACISGTKDQWTPLEHAWKAVLEKHHAPWLHTTDVVSLRAEPFTPENGWDVKKRDSFISDCVKAITQHTALPKTKRLPTGRCGLYSYTVSIVLDDFKMARLTNPSIPHDATEVLATQALYECIKWGQDQRAHFWHLYFDQNEPYRGHVCDRCHNKKTLRDLPQLQRIKHMDELDMTVTPPLQIADLFAWCVSHKNKPPLYGWQQSLLRSPRRDDWMDYNVLINPIPGVRDVVAKWKLPRRAATK